MATRFVSPEIHDQAQDGPATSEGASGYRPGHPGSHPSAEHQKHQYHTHTSESGRSRIRSGPSQQLPDTQPSGLSSHKSRQSMDARPSALASSPPEPSEHVPVMPQVPASYAPQAPPNQPSAFAQPGPHQPLRGIFSPNAIPGHQSTNHMYPNPPTNVFPALLQGLISCIDQDTVRNYLTIAAVHHKDIRDMVEREYERIVEEHEARKKEDAGILSFAQERIRVQKTLNQEYDNLPNPKKWEILNQTLDTINRNIMAIPPLVRPGSNLKTKFNAFLNLIWIGSAIADGEGMLPGAIRAQMVNGSELVKALDHVHAMMTALQSTSQLSNSTAPATLSDGIMRTNEQSNGTPSLNDPESLGGQSSLQAHPEARDVPSGSTVDPRPLQAGPQQPAPYSGSAVCS
ncbi:hypothetical protein KCU78_g7595, partial [Aureobasidium melanogenum]